jgi:methionine-rich copper-binding protein CopC
MRLPQRKYSAPFLLLLFITMSAPLVFAHSHPLSMEPAANATTSSPEKVIIHFSGDLESKFSSITVSNATGQVVSKSASVVGPGDTKLMTVALPHLPSGIYTVRWVAVSVDSHRTQGEYNFTVKE